MSDTPTPADSPKADTPNPADVIAQFVAEYRQEDPGASPDVYDYEEASDVLARLAAHGFEVVQVPDGLPERLRPWHFIAEGDNHLDYEANEDHDYAVLIGDNHWWCAGCLASPSSRFTDGHPSWPNLTAAPNGLRLVIEPVTESMDVTRRPLCPAAALLGGEQSVSPSAHNQEKT